METALVLRIPEAEKLLAAWRLKCDGSAIHGMPAHVTVLFPFKPFEAIDSGCLGKLASLFSASAPFDLTFGRTARFPDTLWLVPDPPAPIARLTKRLAAEFPDYPPYGGAFPDPVPHLTVAQGDKLLLESIAAELADQLAVPVHARVNACSLFARQTEGWREMHQFALLGKT